MIDPVFKSFADVTGITAFNMPYGSFSFLCFSCPHFIFKDMSAYKTSSVLGLYSCGSALASVESWEQFGYSAFLKNTFACIFRDLTSGKSSVNCSLWK